MAGGPTPPQVVVPGAGWIDVASRVVVQVGFPVVVAGVLLWFILGRFTSDVTSIAARLEANATAVEMFTKIQDQQLSEMKAHTAELREQTQLMKEFLARKKYGAREE